MLPRRTPGTENVDEYIAGQATPRPVTRLESIKICVPVVGTRFLKKSVCRSLSFHALPFPIDISWLAQFHHLSQLGILKPPPPTKRSMTSKGAASGTNHLERIELFFDLLSKVRGQAIASGDFASPVIFLAWPSVTENQAGGECCVSLGRRCSRLTVLAQSQGGHEIIFTANGYGASPLMTVSFIDRSGGRA